MAFLGMSDDFDLDDDGILRDSASSTGGFLIDNDGIVRDDLDIYKNTGHWTDSGFGGDKQSSTSTLRQFQASFDEDSHLYDVDHSVNISDLEASKDDVSFEREQSRGNTPIGIVSNRSSLEKPQGFHQADRSANKSDFDKTEEFTEEYTEEYYEQLRELGVLVDGADLSTTKDSLQEYEQLESNYSRDNLLDETGQTDTIVDFFRKESERQLQEQHAYKPQEFGNASETRFRPNSATSNQTVSSHSFPEVSPEEALILYNVNRGNTSVVSRSYEYDGAQRSIDSTGLFHQDGDTSGIFHRTGDDDEIFLITSRMGVHDHVSNHSESGTPAPYSPHSSRPTSRGSVYSSRSQTPYSREGWTQNSTSLTDVSRLGYRQSPVPEHSESPVKKEDQQPLQTRSSSAIPYQNKSRPSSVASHRSTVSEAPNSQPNTARSDSARQLPKTRSEESFFEGNKTPRSSNEKMPKRLLPKPADENQSFRMKSKSTTNISNKPSPLKPTHMSMSDITRFDDGVDGEGDRSHGELSVKLKQEHQKRKQATELVQQLQKDYDSLLSKYALAELTIDQMRLGAKIRLHADSPTPNQIQTGTLSGPQHPQVIQMGTQSRAVVSNSPVAGVVGHFSPQPDSLNLRDNRTPINTPQISDSRVLGRSDRVVGDSRRASLTESEDRGSVSQNVGAERVKTGLLHQAKGLKERIESFNSLLEQRQLTLEEQEEVFENIRTDHEKLRRHYLQAKEDYNVLRRSGASLKDANFDQGKELEGELFRLGMKFDEIHASVDANLKEKSSNRQPFQSNRLTDTMDQSEEEGDEHAVDQLKQKMHGTLAGSDVVPPKEDAEFEQKLQRLHDEYNALMDRYRRLKQMAKTPERDKEIDNLVRKLKQICDEAPDMFRLAPELEERWERMQRQESRGGSRVQSPQPETVPPGAYFLSGSEASKLQRLSQGRRTPDYRSDDSSKYRSDRERDMGTRLKTNDGSDNRKYENMNGYQGNSTKDSYSSRDRTSPLPDRGRFSPSPHDRRSPTQDGRQRSPRDGYSPVIKGAQPGSGRPALNLSRERLLSDGRESSRGRDSPNLSLPRPRRHGHEFRDHQMKKLPDGGSMQSLNDSGISDQEQGALANLPGPGKFKQMTKQRGADDVDSGFIGSVVGSDVSRLTSRQSRQQQQQQQQRQQPLRLRHPSDAPREPQPGTKSRSETGTSTRRDSDSSRDRPRSRSRSKRDSESDRRDSSMQNDSMDVTGSFMDDFTETEVSESDRGQRLGPRRGHDNRKMAGPNQTLEGYTEEDDTDATPKPATKLRISQKPENKEPPSPTKPQRRSRTVVSEEEGEVTPRATPTRGMVGSRYASSSDMETPRSTQIRQSQTGPPKTGVSRAPPVDSQVDRIEAQTVKGRESLTRKNLQQRREERAVGSDREWDRGHESDATRGSSVSSSRLRALQEEVERLKERVEHTVENPPLPPPPPPRDQPEYYDPFDDPYGFMRMPRRRANSFSGANAREWDEWYWTLPQQRQHDGADIPLGYAAADAYADVPPSAAQESPARSRLRRRRMERMKKAEQGNMPAPVPGAPEQHPQGFAGPGPVPGAHPGTAHPVPGAHPGARPAGVPGAVGGAAAAPAPQREGEGPGLYEYYVPSRYSTQGMRQQIASKGYFQTPSGAKIYANQQPGGAQVPQYHHLGAYPHSPPRYAYRGRVSQGYHSDSGAIHASAGTKLPFYTIRRSSQGQRKFSLPRQRQVVHMQSHYDDYDAVDERSGYQTDPGLWTGARPRRVRSYAVETTTCPLCGGSGEHTHAEFEEDGADYFVERSRRPRRRSRSFSSSVSRSRHHSPEHSSYWIREFRTTSSDDTDEEIFRRRRSRSLSRSRRKSRKYHRMRGYHSDADLDESTEVDLNESLNLSEDISRLTRKMLRSVRGELRSAKKREYGSSYW